MIRAYADGDIMDIILGGILKNKHLESKFRSLCAGDVGTKEQQQILKYLMERYVNMRGTFFVKCIKNNNPKSLVDTLAERLYQARRLRTIAALRRALRGLQRRRRTAQSIKASKPTVPEAVSSTMRSNSSGTSSRRSVTPHACSVPRQRRKSAAVSR